MLIDSFGPATRAMEASDFTRLDAESDDENNVDSPAEEMNEDEDNPMVGFIFRVISLEYRVYIKWFPDILADNNLTPKIVACLP